MNNFLLSFQNEYDEQRPRYSDPSAHGPDGGVVSAYVDIYDLQFVVMSGRRTWGWTGLLPLWMAQVCRRGHHRTLPLMELKANI